MSPDSQDTQSRPPNGDETGEPLRLLADLEQETSSTFLKGIERSIYRRITVSQFVSFSWHLPQMLLLEFWSMLSHVLNLDRIDKGGRS